jgi:hypothetical protein
MGNQQERSLGWLAGIIDGEGSVSFQVYTLPDGRVRITPFVCIVNSDEGILNEAWRLLGELTAASTKARPRWCKHNVKNAKSFESRLLCSVIRLDGAAVRLVLAPLLPHLRSKKARSAAAILEYLDSRDAMLLKRDDKGRIERQGYTKAQVELVCSIRTSPLAKSSEAICRAPNVSAG